MDPHWLQIASQLLVNVCGFLQGSAVETMLLAPLHLILLELQKLLLIPPSMILE